MTKTTNTAPVLVVDCVKAEDVRRTFADYCRGQKAAQQEFNATGYDCVLEQGNPHFVLGYN